MTTPDIINSVGVALILLAFVLQQFRVVTGQSASYLWINFAGSALACYGSLLIAAYPFVVLEGVWAVVSLLGLVRPRT